MGLAIVVPVFGVVRVLENLHRSALAQEITVLKLICVKELLLMALECLSLKDAAVVAYIIVILLFEHVTRSYPVYALLAFLDRQSLMQVLAEYEHFVVFCHLLQAVAVQLGRLREVSCFDRLVLEAVEL